MMMTITKYHLVKLMLTYDQNGKVTNFEISSQTDNVPAAIANYLKSHNDKVTFVAAGKDVTLSNVRLDKDNQLTGHVSAPDEGRDGSIYIRIYVDGKPVDVHKVPIYTLTNGEETPTETDVPYAEKTRATGANFSVDLSDFANQLTKDTKITVVATRYLVDSNQVAVVQDQTDTDVPEPGVKDTSNIMNYVDEHGNVVKHDTVTGDEGDPIGVAMPAGYRIEDGNMPAFVIDSHNPVHIVTITKDQHDTDNPEVVTKPLLNIIKYVDEHGNVVKTETVNGNLGDQITLTLPAGYHFKNVETPNIVITESGVQIVNVVKDRQVTPGNLTINDNNKNGNNSVVDNKDASQDNNGKIVSTAAIIMLINTSKASYHKQVTNHMITLPLLV